MDNHAQEVHMARSTHDRKRMWQEMRQRNTNWSSEEENPDTKKSKKVLEANLTNQSQKTVTRSDQSDNQNDGVLMKLWGNIQL